MYQAYWGLRESPFRGLVDPEFFYQSPTHDEALARLHFLVQQQRRLGLVLGRSGSGKSLLLTVLASQLQDTLPVARLSLLGVEPCEMLWSIASQWGLCLDPTPSLPALWRAVTDRLVEYRYQQLGAVVLLDDVDQADAGTLRHVARLARYDLSPRTRLSIVLAGRKEQMLTLDDRLLDQAELRIDLESWEPADTERCVTTLLAQAGRRSPVFAESAVARLHALSQGVPRRVSQLADLALVAGAGQELLQIDAGVVDGVYQEFCR